MPNQRKKGTKLVGAFVSEETKAEVKKLAKAKGLNLADFIREAIQEKVSQDLRNKGKDNG